MTQEDKKTTGLEEQDELLLRQYIGAEWVHYVGGVVSGATLFKLFGDAATLIMVKHCGDESLLASYQDAQLMQPLQVGDFIEVWGRIDKVGKRSRQLVLKAYRVAGSLNDPECPSRSVWLEEPVLVGTARLTCVVP